MKLTILLFGEIAEKINASTCQIDFVSDTDALKVALLEKYNFLANIQHSLVVNQKIIDQNVKIKEKDEIAILPAFAGG